MSKNAELFPDINYKMSKKIAQLTKVIYQLNSKNEDHQIDLDHQQANHTAEIQHILRDAATKISKFKEALENKQKSVNEEAYMEKLVKKYETEKQKAQQDLLAYQAQVKENEEQLANVYLAKFNGLKTQSEAMNEQFASRVVLFETTCSDLKSSHDDAKLKMKQKHEMEMSSLLAAGNKKYEEAMNDAARVRQALEAEWTRRSQEAVDRTRAEGKQAAQQQLAVLCTELAAEKDAAVAGLRRELEEQMLQQRNQLTDRAEGLRRELRVKSSELDTLKQQSAARESDLCSQISELERFISQQEGDVDANRRQLLSELSASKQDLQTKCAEIIEQREEIARLSRLLTLNNTRVADLEASLKSVNYELLEVKDVAQRHEAQLLARSTGAERERDNHAANLVALEERIASLTLSWEAQKVKYEHDLEAAGAGLAKVSRELSEALLSTTAADERAAMLQQMSQRELELAQERLASEAALQLKYNDEIKSMEENIEWLKAEQAAAAERHIRESDEVLRSHASSLLAKDKDIDALTETNKRLVQEMQQSLGDTLGELASFRERAEQERLASQETMLHLESTVKELGAKCAALSQQVDSSMQARHALEEELVHARREIQSKSSSFEDQLRGAHASLELEWSEKLRALSLTHSQAMDRLQGEHRTAMLQSSDTLTKEHNAAYSALSSLLLKTRDDLASNQTILAQERDRSEERIRLALGSSEALQLEFESKLTKERDLFDSRIKDELASVEGRLFEEARRREEELKTEHSQLMDEVRLQHEQVLAILRSEHAAELKHVGREGEAVALASLQSQKAQMLAEKKSELSALEAKHAATEAELKRAQDAAETELHKKYTDVAQKLMDSERKVSDLSGQIEVVRSQMLALVSKFDGEKENMLHYAADQLSREKDRNERLRADEKSKYASELDAVRRKHSESLSVLESQNLRLKEQNAELELRWTHRESRPEDMDHIRQLEESLSERTQQLQRTKEEMMYFKREMINREESYNTKFNVSPVVGVMNVVKPKDAKKPPKPTATDPGRRASFGTTSSTNIGSVPIGVLGSASGDDVTLKSTTKQVPR